MKRFISFATVSLTTLALLAGCATTTEEKHAPTEMAAYAAANNFPTNLRPQTSDRVGVLVEPASKILRILNFGPTPVTAADIWINGTFLYKVDSIPANGFVRLDETMFYDHGGHTLADQQVRINAVQIYSGGQLWTLLGPITQ